MSICIPLGNIEKEVDYHISVKNNFWNATVLSAAGTLGLTFIQQLFYVPIGLIAIFIFMFGYFNKCEKIESLVKEIKKGTKKNDNI